MCGLGWKWEWSGRARDHYASEISDRKWAPKKRPVIAHIKARSKHSFQTETAWHYSLVNQTAPTSVLDVLHHQHEEGGSGHSGTVFETQRNV